MKESRDCVAANSPSEIPSPGAPPRLEQLYFYLTAGCNLACRHCWLAPKYDGDGSHHPVLAPDLFAAVIREARPLGLTGVKLTGGEPLLHPQIVELLHLVRDEALALTVETNGLLCTPALAQEMARCSECFVSVSLDGVDAATHEYVRGIPGSFSAAVQAVRNLSAAGASPQIIMSLMACNAGQVQAMVQLAEQLGASSIKFNIVQPTGRGQTVSGGTQGLSVPELLRLGRYVELELAPTTRLPLYFDYPLAFRPLSRIAAGDAGACGVLNILGVLPQGQYALCGIGQHIPELVFGTAGQDRLEEVWRDNPVLNGLRSGLPDRLVGVCAHCLMRGRCLGSCLAQNYYRTGNVWSAFWFCEEAYTVSLFPSSRLGILSS